MEIIIKVADLMKKAQELSDDNMPEVIVSFDEGDDDLPPALCFIALAPGSWSLNPHIPPGGHGQPHTFQWTRSVCGSSTTRSKAHLGSSKALMDTYSRPPQGGQEGLRLFKEA